MKLFSQRYGFKLVRTILQKDSIDDELRNRLWNALKDFYWETIKNYESLIKRLIKTSEIYEHLIKISEKFFKKLWDKFFKKPLDEIEWYLIHYDYSELIRKKIYPWFFNCNWYEVYDFLEFIVTTFPDKQINEKFIEYCNQILEEEKSAYRFVEKN